MAIAEISYIDILSRFINGTKGYWFRLGIDRAKQSVCREFGKIEPFNIFDELNVGCGIAKTETDAVGCPARCHGRKKVDLAVDGGMGLQCVHVHAGVNELNGLVQRRSVPRLSTCTGY